jgi:hypothetical protein
MVLAQRADARDTAFDLWFGRGEQVQRKKEKANLPAARTVCERGK